MHHQRKQVCLSYSAFSVFAFFPPQPVKWTENLITSYLTFIHSFYETVLMGWKAEKHPGRHTHSHLRAILASLGSPDLHVFRQCSQCSWRKLSCGPGESMQTPDRRDPGCPGTQDHLTVRQQHYQLRHPATHITLQSGRNQKIHVN